MASGYVQVPPDSSGKKVDCVSISSGAVRQVVTVGDPTTSSGLATVTGGKLNVNASVGALPNVNISAMPNVNISSMPTVTVQGNVSATIIGSLPNINISSMPNVTIGGGSLQVSNNIGVDRIVQTVLAVVTQAINISSMPAISVGPISTIDKISATVNVVVTNAINISSMPAISVGPISTIDKISATVLAAVTNNLNISAMPAVSLAAGATLDGISKTVNVAITNAINISSMPAISVGPISTIDRISATVTVAGSVLLGGAIAGKVNVVTAPNDYVYISGPVAPGAAGTGYYPVHMGGLDNGGIARTMKMDASGIVQVAVTNTTVPVSGTLDKISATVAAVLAAGTANIGTINNISAAVVLAAGSNNIGTINGISATVTVVSAYPRALPSASHGPKVVTLSTSSNVALAAAPGAGLSVYVTSMVVTNGSSSLTRFDAFPGTNSATPEVCAYLAASGGGFTHTFDPPYKVSANAALNARVKPNASQVIVTLNFVVGA